MPILPTMSQARIISEIRNSMKLHLNSEIQIPSVLIKRMRFTRMDEEYKNICHFTYKGIYYVVPSEYEIYSIDIELADKAGDYILLYPLEFGKYKGSYKTILKREITAKFPDTWDKDLIRQWCEDETEKTLSLCRALP